MVESPGDQASSRDQLLRAPSDVGADDRALKVGQEAADRPTDVEPTTLKGEEAHRHAARIEDGDLHIPTDRGDLLRELWTEVGASQGRLGLLEVRPRREQPGRELLPPEQREPQVRWRRSLTGGRSGRSRGLSRAR